MLPRPPATATTPVSPAVPRGRRPALDPAPARRGPNGAALARGAAVTGAYAVLLIGFTWPLAAHLGDRFILTYGIDLWQNLWNFAWVRTALAELHQSPYYTYSIFYPTGVPLVYHALNLFSAAVSIPLAGVWGLAAAFNLVLLGSLLAAALAAYWLARVLGLPRGAAFLAGLIFACGPTMSAAVNQGQSEQYSTFWMPLYAGLLIRGGGLRALGLPPGRRWYLVAAGLVLAASVFAIYYWFVALAVFTAIYATMEGWSALRAGGAAALRPLVARLALLAAVTAVALIPLGVVLVQTQLQGGDSLVLYRSAGGDVLTISGSQDLLGFFVPLPNHANPRGVVDGPGPRGSRYGLGWSVLLLAGVGVIAARRRVALWGAAGLVLAVLALGPTLIIAGNVTSIPLPYAAILQIPGAAAMRAPDRFLVLLTLCTAVLAAFGLAALGARLRPRGRAALLLLALAARRGRVLRRASDARQRRGRADLSPAGRAAVALPG